MDKSCSTLIMPAGTLAQMRPFKRWLAEQPRHQVALGETDEQHDVVHFNTCLCPGYLIRALKHLLAPHAPYHLYLNLPVPERKTGAMHVHATERGVLAESLKWEKVGPVERAHWLEALEAQGGRRQFSLQERLFPDL